VTRLGVSRATRDRDLVIQTVRDELIQFMARKFASVRGKDFKKMGADVVCMVETLAEAMAVLHVDAIRSLSDGDTGSYERKLALARAKEPSTKPTK
jgi:hypothetical protein